MDMRTVGDKVHSHNSNCIYSVANLMGTLLSSLCQSLNKEQLAWSLATLQDLSLKLVIIVIMMKNVTYIA